MPPYRVSLSQEASERLRLMPPQDQREVYRLLGLIAVDPSIDGVHKITYPKPPAVYTAYVTSQFWIVYHVIRTAVRVVTLWRTSDNGSASD